MLSQRNVSIFSITGLVTLLLFNFQNCAPAAISAQGDPGSSGVRLIEDFNKAEIQFVAPDVQLYDEATAADVSGLCNRSHDGARLKWTIWGSAGDVMLQGSSVCQKGAFTVHLPGLEQMVCGVDHQLVIEGDWGGLAFTHFLRRCEPLASEPVASNDALPYGTRCNLEYVPAGDDVSPCAEVCYRDEKMVRQSPVDPGRCSNLIARLAGP